MSYVNVQPNQAAPVQIGGIARLVSKPVVSGAIGALAAKLLLAPGYVEFMNYRIDVPIAYGIVIGSASAVNSATKEVVLPLIGINDPLSYAAQMIAAPALTGAMTVGLSIGVNGFALPEKRDALNAFLIGAASEIGSDYATAWLKQM